MDVVAFIDAIMSIWKGFKNLFDICLSYMWNWFQNNFWSPRSRLFNGSKWMLMPSLMLECTTKRGLRNLLTYVSHIWANDFKEAFDSPPLNFWFKINKFYEHVWLHAWISPLISMLLRSGHKVPLQGLHYCNKICALRNEVAISFFDPALKILLTDFEYTWKLFVNRPKGLACNVSCINEAHKFPWELSLIYERYFQRKILDPQYCFLDLVWFLEFWSKR